MRVTQAGLYNSAISQMQQQQTKVFETQEQLASGKKIAKPSDDPALAAAVNNLQSKMAENERYMTNLDRVMSTMQMQETAVASGVEQLNRFKVLAVQGANDTYSDDDRRSVAIEMRELIAGIVDVANMRNVDGAYLFSGFDQQQRPFAEVDGKLSYRGSHDYQQVMIDEGRSMEMGLPGSAVFGSVHHTGGESADPKSIDFFATLENMVAAIENGDQVGINNALDEVNSVHEHMVTHEANIGARMSRVDNMRQTLEQRDFTYQKLQSELEDLDYVEAASRLKNQTLALQAGQQSFAQLSNLSLFQYIR